MMHLPSIYSAVVMCTLISVLNVCKSDTQLYFIASINFDGSDGRIDKTISGSNIRGMAIDSNERLLFYTEWTLKVIVKLNLDNMAESETIVSDGLSIPGAISVIASERTVYWSDVGYDKIEKASYNGSNRQTLFDTSLSRVDSFAIDYRDGLLYWIDYFVQRIEVSNIDGSTNRTTVKDISPVYPCGIAFHNQQLWISDWNLNSIYKLNLSSGIMEIVSSGLGRPCELHVLTLESCGVIRILNGRLNTTRTRYNTSVEVTCDAGYPISGAHVVRCQEDGHWSDLPTCEIVDSKDVNTSLPRILGLTIGCVTVIAMVIGIAIFIARRQRWKNKPHINCLTAPLDATIWDLLIVVDAKDRLMIITERLMDALNSLTPTRHIKRTNIHRVHIETNKIECRKVIFFICNGYSSPRDCVRVWTKNIRFMTNIQDSSLIISADDTSFENFKVFNIARGCGEIYDAGLPVCSNEHNWIVSFVRMYFNCKWKVHDIFEIKLNMHIEAPTLTFRQSIVNLLTEFGFKQSSEMKEKGFKVCVINKMSEIYTIIDNIEISNVKRFYLFVNEMTVVIPKEILKTCKAVRIFSKSEVIKGILHALAESGAINVKLQHKKKSLTKADA